MINIPRLTEKDLAILKGKKVLVYGGIHPINLFKIFKALKIDVLGICLNDTSPQTILKAKYLGLKIIKPSDVSNVISKHDNIIIQSSSSDPVEIAEIKNKASEFGVMFSNLLAGEISSSFSYLILSKELRNPLIYTYQKSSRKKFLTRKTTPELSKFLNKKADNSIIICSATKTADHSMLYTFNSLNAEIDKGMIDSKKIEYINLWHRPQYINRELCEKNFGKLKVVMGVREPISQNVSHLYQWLSKGTILANCVFPALETTKNKDKNTIINEFEKLFGEKGNDFQALWDMYTELYTNSDGGVPQNLDHVGFIQLFIPMFQKYVMDILSFPFDKEKGYAIMKDGNTEVFIYQLEKLNSVIPELSDWVGVPFKKLVNGNEASSKWIGDSYKQAQKEVTFSKEYFDKCYNSPYVKHFYSDEDIEKFKNKWQSHIM